MTRTFLRWHLWAWCLIAPALAVLLVLALLDRPAVPADQALPGWLMQPLVQPAVQPLKAGR